MMEHISDPNTSQTVDAPVMTHPDRDKNSHGISGFFPAIVNMIAEDGGNFFRYLKALGLSRENNLVVLSSRYHYYYDENEMKSVKTLINLRKLNMIKYLDEFLTTLVHILPPDTKFLGCFYDSKVPLKNGFSIIHPLKLLRQKINILDLNGERTMNKASASEILESHGFKILNMTEINGITYFCTQKLRKIVELRA
jgi:hypothetical protein